MWKSLTKKQSAADQVAASLEQHELELLKHQESIEYHTRMAEYSADVIRRLKDFQPLTIKKNKD